MPKKKRCQVPFSIYYGVEGVSDSLTADIDYTGAVGFLIGATARYSSEYLFNGKIDEVRIYNRALSQSEITALYNNPATINNTGLAGHWKFDEAPFSEQRKFAGHELDTDTGLSYMNARYYNGKIGRFISQDLKAERLSQAQLVEAKSRAEIQLIEAKAAANKDIVEAEGRAKMQEIIARRDAQTMEINTAAEVKAQKEKSRAEIEMIKNKQESATIMDKFPSLLRLKEIEAFKELAKNSNARIYFGFDKYWTKEDSKIVDK